MNGWSIVLGRLEFYKLYYLMLNMAHQFINIPIIIVIIIRVMNVS